MTRESTPLRIAFLHRPAAGGGAGALAAFVRERRAVALDLLLFAHTVLPLSNPEPIIASSSEWAKAIVLPDAQGNAATISRSWSWLEDIELVATERSGRSRAVRLLCEDRSGRPWTIPSYQSEPYFRLPNAYWTGGFSRDLSVSGKAVLLVALSLQSRQEDYFELPLVRAAGWYGLSASTIQRGLSELQRVALLRSWSEKRQTERSPIGYTYDRRYALNSLVAVGSQRTYRSRGGSKLKASSGDIPY